MKFRIGHGIDTHAFEPGDHVMLGGVKIPYTKGVQAHSDGDVILHSITDALLGALCMGDLGQWFPDTDPNLRGIQSKDLLLPIIMSMRSNGYELNNLDITVIAQAPKISEYSDQIRQSIANIFSADVKVINLKATSTERLGAIGRNEGISAHAVISIIGDTVVAKNIADTNDFKEITNEIDVSDMSNEAVEIDLSQEIDIRDFNFNDSD